MAMGLGISQMAGHYCHMCASHTCHHVMGSNQLAQSNAAYNDLIRQYANQQQSGLSNALTRPDLLHGIIVSNGSSVSVGQLPEPKPNKKLLLLME